MGQYANDPQADARIKRSHDNWVTNDDEWQRYAAREEDEEEPTEGIKENLEGIPSNVDLEKEVSKWWDASFPEPDFKFRKHRAHIVSNDEIIHLARHFYELGLNARKEK